MAKSAFPPKPSVLPWYHVEAARWSVVRPAIALVGVVIYDVVGFYTFGVVLLIHDVIHSTDESPPDAFTHADSQILTGSFQVIVVGTAVLLLLTLILSAHPDREVIKLAMSFGITALMMPVVWLVYVWWASDQLYAFYSL